MLFGSIGSAVSVSVAGPHSLCLVALVSASLLVAEHSLVVSDGPIHVIKYSNSIQEINWLYSLFIASVIPGVSTRSLDRTKLIVYTTSLPLFIKDSNMCNYKIQLYSIVSIRVRLQFVSKHKANRMTHVNSCSIIVRV